MTQNLTRTEKMVILGLTVGSISLAVFMSQLQISASSPEVISQNVNYKMGKAIDQISAYTIEGREIIRQLIKSETPSPVSNKVSAQVVSGTVKASDQKNASRDQKASDKNQKSGLKKLPNQDFAKQDKTNSSADRFETSEGLNVESKNRFDSVNNNSALNSNPLVGSNSGAVLPNDGSNSDENPVATKTLEQIRAQFLSSPINTTMQTIVSSFKKGEFSSSVFYQFQSELLESQNNSHIGLALYALRLTPSLESFSILAQYQPNAPESYQAYIQESLLAYNQASFIGLLSSAIRSGDKVVVLKALQIIQTGIASIKSGNTAQLVDSRNRRESTLTNFNLQNYASLVPAISSVMTNATNDTDLLGLLEQTRTLISENIQQVASNG